MKKTTVVIPNYNGIEYLRDCLLSLSTNVCDDFDFDIIVVDNGSTDGSVECVREEFEAVKLISLPKNLGFAAAVNIGIKEADTQYVLLLNNDIKVREGFVRSLECCIDESTDIFSVNSVMISMSDNSVLDGIGDYYCALGWAFAYKKGKKVESVLRTGSDAASFEYSGAETLDIFSACAGASIYRKDLLMQLGCFDENHFAYLEDVDIGYRARINGYRNVFIRNAICEHAGSGYSGSRYNEFKISLASRNSIYLIYKNMPLLQVLINLPFLIIGFVIKILFFVFKGYGITYCKGLCEGIRMCFFKQARAKKVRFKTKNAKNYVLIQIQLWINMVRRFL